MGSTPAGCTIPRFHFPMKTNARLVLLLIAGLSVAGCTSHYYSDGRWFSSREGFERHRLDGEFARLQKLYESGAIDAETLTTRREALRDRQEQLNKQDREEAIRRASEPDPFPTTTDCPSRDDRHPSTTWHRNIGRGRDGAFHAAEKSGLLLCERSHNFPFPFGARCGSCTQIERPLGDSYSLRNRMVAFK